MPSHPSRRTQLYLERTPARGSKGPAARTEVGCWGRSGRECVLCVCVHACACVCVVYMVCVCARVCMRCARCASVRVRAGKEEG